MKQFDVIVIGSGPAGQKAAVQAAKAGKSVAIVERDQWLGGACVHRGTIPSKTLRENALRVKKMRENAALCNFELAEDTEMSTLIDRLHKVLKAHDGFMVSQIKRNDIVVFSWPADTVHRFHVSQKGVRKPIDKKSNYVKRCVGIPGDSDVTFKPNAPLLFTSPFKLVDS